MQTGKSAAAAVKETATNIVASAQSGMEKTTATVQEKVEKMTAHDPLEKELATQRKEEKFKEAEMYKQQVRKQNATSRTHASGVSGGLPTGVRGAPTRLNQVSAIPGHGTGEPQGGHVTEGVVGSHPVGINSGTGRTVAKNRASGTGAANQGYTGGTYT